MPGEKTKDKGIDAYAILVRVCSVCSSEDGVKFEDLANCNLCTKCQDELSDSLYYAFCRDDDEVEL